MSATYATQCFIIVFRRFRRPCRGSGG